MLKDIIHDPLLVVALFLIVLSVGGALLIGDMMANKR